MSRREWLRFLAAVAVGVMLLFVAILLVTGWYVLLFPGEVKP